MTEHDHACIRQELQPGETLHWCGKPTPTWWSPATRPFIVQGCSVLIIWGLLTSQISPCTLELWLLAQVPSVLFFLLLSVLCPLGQWLSLSRRLYAITSSRAMVIERTSVHSWPLKPNMVIEHLSQAPGSLVFSYSRSSFSFLRHMPQGFLHVEGADEALHTLQTLLHGQALMPHLTREPEMIEKLRHCQAMALARSAKRGIIIPATLVVSFILSAASLWWFIVHLQGRPAHSDAVMWYALPGLALLCSLVMALITAYQWREYKLGLKLLAKREQAS